MKNIATSLSALLILFACTTKNTSMEDKSSNSEVTDTINFDQKLAEKLGADDYGMHQYVIAFLKRGPNREN